MENADEIDFSRIPLEERCQHKVWKARVSGYNDAIKLFNTQDDEKSPEFQKYVVMIKKFVTDNNAVALEKGIAAALAFVTNAACAGKICGEVTSAIIAKGLAVPKAKTRELSLEIILMYVEIEKQDATVEELIKGLDNKSPKVVSACIAAIREALHAFGSKVVPIKPLIKILPKLLEDRDKTVRDESKLLCVEIYRWIGDAIKHQFQSLKPAILADLEKEYEKVQGQSATPTRYLRSQQVKMAAVAQGDGGSEHVQAEAAPVEVDPFEYMAPVDILSQLPKNFYEQCEDKKWQIRKEALEKLQKLSTDVKLEPGDYGELVRALKKFIGKDTNVIVVSLACKCLTNLVLGLRKKMQPYFGMCVPVLLEKLKEKKQGVVLALREALDAIYAITTLDALLEDVQAALGNKNPQIRAETISFLTRCFAKCNPSHLPKKILKPLCASLVKTINDTDLSVRDNTAEALGTIYKVVGEKTISPFLQEIDAIKMGKIKDCCEKAVITAVPQSLETAKSDRTSPCVSESSDPIRPTKAAPTKPVAGGIKKPATNQPARKTAAPSRIGKPQGSKKTGGIGDAPSSEPLFVERELSSEEVVEQVSVIVSEEVMNGLNSSNWKDRLSAVEKLFSTLQQMAKNEIPSQALIKLIAKKPGFKENNPQILKLRFEILSYIADNAPVSAHSVTSCLSDIVDKLGDAKNGPTAVAALTSLASATSLEYMSIEVLNLSSAQKNPKNQAEALVWLSNAVKLFGLKIPVRDVIGHLKKAFSSTNPTVKSAALTLVSTLYMYVGKPLRGFFEDEKPALLQQIDAEFEKVVGLPPPMPERGVKPNEAGGDGSNKQAALSDIFARVDISGQITTQLLTNLADKDWKTRLEALQNILSVINDAKYITSNLGDLPIALKPRLTDTNKKLASQALAVCEKLGEALGPNCSKQLRNFSPGILATLGDSKANIRTCGVQCLNVWMDNCPVSSLFEGETVLEALRSDNPFLRIELFTWLTEKLPSATTVPASELGPCYSLLYSCLEDRNVDVRKKASDCVVPFMIHGGFESMARAASKLKPSSKANILSQLEKARGSVPEKPSSGKSKQTKGTVAASGHGSPPSPSGGNDGDENFKGKMNRSTSKNKLALKPGTARTKKDEDVDSSPPFVVNNLKDQRLVDEKCLKVLKWNFSSPREEFYTQLKDQMVIANWSRTLVSYCYHNDFKFHNKAIDVFIECINNNLDATISNLDLILKWLALRFFDTNPSVLMKALEYLQMLFEILINQRYKLIEAEASSFIPYLILKIGDPKDNVRKGVKEIIKLITKVYPSSKLFTYIMQGLSCKNARQRTECLDELGAMIELYGLSVCQPSPAVALKEIAKQISDRDNAVRNASLNCIVQAYFIDGEKVMKYVGPLMEKDMSLLEERIKRSTKTRVNKPREPLNETQIPSRSPPMATEEPESKTVFKKSPAKDQSKGPITLDLDEFEELFRSKEITSQNTGTLPTDADEILNLPDIELPLTKLRPPATSVKLLNNSTKAVDAVNLVMAQLTAQEISIVVEAFAQVEELLRHDARAEAVMGPRVDQLLVMGALQYRLAHTKHMADENICKADVIKLYRGVSVALVSLFEHPTLAKKASRDVLRDLIPHLVTVILDSRLNELQEGPNVVRITNILIIRILQKSNQTNVLSALIKLLHDCVGNMHTNDRFTDLIMKCLWKMTRLIKTFIDQLDVDRILVDLHNFLKTYPSSSWKDRPDTPIRTVKTILYTLVEMLGDSILKHLMLIPNKEESDLYHYLRKLLKMQKEKARNKDVKQEDTTPDRENSGQRKSSLKLSRSTHDSLTEIFKKIGLREQTNVGLRELYEFKKDHPEANIDPFMERSSQYFQNYVNKGLKDFEERDSQNFLSSSSSPDVVPKHIESYSYKMELQQKFAEYTQIEKGALESWRSTFPPYPPLTQDTTVMDWAEWLKVVASRLGLDSSKYNDPEVMKQILGEELNPNRSVEEIQQYTELLQNKFSKIQEVVENMKKTDLV